MGRTEELGQVVAGDVLDDLPAGAGDGPVRKHHGDADDEVSQRPVTVAQRAGVAGGEGAAEWLRRSGHSPGRGRGTVRRSAEPGLQLGDRHAGAGDDGEVACLVNERRPERRRVEQELRRAAPVCPRRRSAAAIALDGGACSCRLGEQVARLAKARPDDATVDDLTIGRSPRPPRAGCGRYGPGRSPQSLGVGKALPGLQRPSGSKAVRTRSMAREVVLGEHHRHRAGLVDTDAVLAGDRAAGVHAQLDDAARDRFRPLDLASPRRRRRGRGGAGCRHRHGRRWRHEGRPRRRGGRSVPARDRALSAG